MVVELVILADLRLLPAWLAVVYDFPGGDKLGHLLIFGALMAAVDMLPCARGRGCRTWRAALVMLCVGGEELSQAWFSSRTASALELACSYCGIVVALSWRTRARVSRAGVRAPPASPAPH